MSPVSDFLIRIKNASMAGKPFVSAPYSNMKFAIAKLLKEKGFVGEVHKKGRKNGKYLEVGILYDNKKSRVNDIKLMSKPSRRTYGKVKEVRAYRQGYGMTVYSTPKGILADSDVKRENVGGEILFKIW
ncbi:MAG: 30S ribosomal protein S8 [Patescibacteria group bacterium]